MLTASPVLVPYLSLASLTALAGVAKLRDGRLATTAATQFGLRGRAVAAVRAVAILELAAAIGAWTGVLATVAASVLAGLYLAFAVVTAALWRRGEEVSCGCFGVHSISVTPWHVALNVLGCGVSLLAAALPARLWDMPTAGQLLAAGVEITVGTYLLLMAYTQSDVQAHRAAVLAAAKETR